MEGSEDPQDLEPPGVLQAMTYEEREEEFLRLIGSGIPIRAASANVAISYSSLYRKRQNDPAFAKRWEEACRVNVPRLEAEGLRRAMAGSDKLLMFMLERLAPEKFGRKERLELTNPDGSLAPSPEDRAARVEALMALAQARKAAKVVDDLL